MHTKPQLIHPINATQKSLYVHWIERRWTEIVYPLIFDFLASQFLVDEDFFPSPTWVVYICVCVSYLLSYILFCMSTSSMTVENTQVKCTQWDSLFFFVCFLMLPFLCLNVLRLPSICDDVMWWMCVVKKTCGCKNDWDWRFSKSRGFLA